MFNLKFFLLLVLPGVALATSFPQLIPFGSKQIFDFKNHVKLLDVKEATSSLAYQIQSTLTVSSVWNSKESQLLYFELDPPKLCTNSSKNDLKTDCINRNSPQLSILSQLKFFLLTEGNKVTFLATNNELDTHILNLKKGVASLFQVQATDEPITERDISGDCNVFYHTLTAMKLIKTKKHCRHWDSKVNFRFEKPLGVAGQSFQEINYETTEHGFLNKLTSIEFHSRYVEAKPDLGSKIESIIELELRSSVDAAQLKASESMGVLPLLKTFEPFDIEADIDGKMNHIKISLKQLVKSEISEMTNSKIGKLSSALVLAKLLPAARITKTDEFVQILKSPSTQNIQNQLIDLLGATQTIEAHDAFNQVFLFENEDDFDSVERYLQSLAIATRANKDIFLNLYEQLRNTKIENDKLRDTLIQTLSSIAAKYSVFSTKGYDDELVLKIKNYLLHKLNECESPECQTVFIRGLQNLRDPSTIEFLVSVALKEKSIASVAAMKALIIFPKQFFSEKNRKDFEKIFFQIPKQFDSTARTSALDILLEMEPSKVQLVELLQFLQSNDMAFEVKTYLIQKIRMISEKCPKFMAVVDGIIKENPEITNYYVMAQKGLSTVLQRNLANAPALNETLISVQEIAGGVLKQGSVDLILNANKDELSTFKLGLYTSGLASFVSSATGENAQEDELPSTAGMEITVQGVHFRPLVFFNGQSELMGHVWSGTASEPTVAYQSTVLQQDHEEYILLQNGATVYLRVLGPKSIELNGQVEFSIWNRNAHTEINQNSGVAVVGVLEYGTSFVWMENKFSTGTEPKVNVVADIDFYSDIMLCIQLGKPDVNLWHKIENSLEIINTKYSSRSTLKNKYQLPGSTMALNQKNNEMCNKIAS